MAARGRWMKLYGDVVLRKAHYTDAQFRALITAYTTALSMDGRLPPRKAISALWGKAIVDFLFDEGDLIENEDHEVTIHRWAEYQSRDVTAAERQRRHRENVASRSVTRDQRVTSTSISTTEIDTPQTEATLAPAREAEPEVEHDALDLYHELTLYRPWGVWSGDKLRVAQREYGDEAVQAAMRKVEAKHVGRDKLLAETLTELARETERRLRAKPKPERKPATMDAETKARYDAVRAELAAEAATITQQENPG